MHVEEVNSALLCNYEVLETLRRNTLLQNTVEYRSTQFQDLRTVEYEVKKYLQETPCGSQTTDQIDACLTQLKPFKLTKAEKLMLLNCRPTSIVELNAVIEECDGRFDEDALAGMLKVLDETVPYQRPSLNEEGT